MLIGQSGRSGWNRFTDFLQNLLFNCYGLVLNWQSTNIQINQFQKTIFYYAFHRLDLINLSKTIPNLLYISNQSVPRCKHFPPRL